MCKGFNDSSQNVERKLPTQLLLGRCLLKLQECELLLKRLLAQSSFSGPPGEVSALYAERASSFQKKMMGELVGTLTKTFLTEAAAQDDSYVFDTQPNNVVWVQTRTQIVYAEESYVAVTDALKELVLLRNELVHHFISKFDLNTARGCAEAEAFLSLSYAKIEKNFQLLQTWHSTMVEAHTKLLSVCNDPSFDDFIDGICPDGTIDWARAGIVQGLRDAEAALAKDGWTSLAAAIKWLSKSSPEQRPRRYRCNSWRQVLHESRQFEVTKRASLSSSRNSERAQAETVWFRSRRQDNAEQSNMFAT